MKNRAYDCPPDARASARLSGGSAAKWHEPDTSNDRLFSCLKRASTFQQTRYDVLIDTFANARNNAHKKSR
jgi:hypothetical protein